MLGDNLIHGVVLANDSRNKVLGGFVDESDHSAHAVEPPQDKLGVGIQSTIVDDRLVDAMATDRIHTLVKRRKESGRRAISVSSAIRGRSFREWIMHSGARRRKVLAYFLSSRAR